MDSADRLSSLPESILSQILSLLPIQSVLATPFLSRNWRYRWKGVTHLVFKYHNSTSFFSNVDDILSGLTSRKLHTFVVEFPSRSNLEDNSPLSYSSLENWISTCCDRLVERLEVTVGGGLRSSGSPSIMLPTSTVQCQSIVVLSLKGPFYFNIMGGRDVALPMLKKLELAFSVLYSELLAKIFESCILLEELSLSAYSIDGDIYLRLSAPKLKKLVISIWDHLPQGKQFLITGSRIEHLTFSAPSVRYFHFGDLSALVTADLCSDFRLIVGNNYLDHVAELVNLIQSVSTLLLNSATLKHFNNLSSVWSLLCLTEVNIKLDANPMPRWNDLLCFLGGCPNLEVLILDMFTLGMKFHVPNSDPPCGLTLLRRIDISRFRGDSDDVKMIEYILRHSPALERLSLDVLVGRSDSENFHWNEYELCHKVFFLERSSLACEIFFSGRFLKASSKGFNNKAPCCRFIQLGIMEFEVEGNLESKDKVISKPVSGSKDGHLIRTHTINLGCSSIPSWNEVMNFLRESPNLEDLQVNFNTPHQHMEWIVPNDEPPCALTLLKRIAIKGFDGSGVDLKVMAYILKSAQSLQLLSLDMGLGTGCGEYSGHVTCDYSDDYGYYGYSDSSIWDEYHLCWELFTLERSSLACEVEFSGKFLEAVSKAFTSRVPRYQIMRLGYLVASQKNKEDSETKEVALQAKGKKPDLQPK